MSRIREYRACPIATAHSEVVKRSAAKQVRAHDLHTPHCKRLISIVNRTDPSSGPRTGGAISYSFLGSSRRSVGPIDYWGDGSFYRHASKTAFVALRRGTRRLESEGARESCQCTRGAHAASIPCH